MGDEEFKKLGRRLGDLGDLPEELRSQLQATKKDELENQIIQVLDELYQGMANIDEILVGLYRKYEVNQKRQFIANKLYRMTQDELIYSVKGKKGVYTSQKKLEDYFNPEKN